MYQSAARVESRGVGRSTCLGSAVLFRAAPGGSGQIAACRRREFAGGFPSKYPSPAVSEPESPLVSIVMGSASDWESTMIHASRTLEGLGIPHEVRVLSAHRTPDALAEHIAGAESRGIEVILAGAGGAAHLAGAIAARTSLPVLGVPVETPALGGLDSLLSTVQMPSGVPVGTLGIGAAGAKNAALLAAAILALKYPNIREAWRKYREDQTKAVLANPDPRKRG